MNREPLTHPSAAWSQPGQQPSLGDRIRTSKALLPTLAVLSVTVLALAATLVSRRIDAAGGAPQPVAVVQSPAALQTPAAPVQPVAAGVVQAPVARSSERPPAPRAAVAAPAQVAAAVCANCGVVESVATVQRQARVNGVGNTEIGVGAIGGAVVGGLLGNQIGGGSGRTAATVLGAAGGAYAGHAIEKNTRKYTAYQMRVRMQDGSVRTVEQSTAVAAGSRVVVEGGRVRVTQPAAS